MLNHYRQLDQKLLMAFLEKIKGTLIRLWHAILFLPKRLLRLLQHIYLGVLGSKNPKVTLPINRYGQWWIEFVFYLFDVLAIPEIYESFMDWGKWKTRPLTINEIKLARSIYGNSIFYERVRVDETAHIACKHHHLLYVSFYTINSWGEFRPDIFIHEMMHIWQFQKLGGVYIPRALLAQWTPLGYNYGGLEKLKEAKNKGGNFENFNIEQQADIVTDYYCIREGMIPRWCHNEIVEAKPIFEYFIKKLQT